MMRPVTRRLAVVRSGSQPSWKSCRSIVSNLEASYEDLARRGAVPDARFFRIGRAQEPSQEVREIQRLREFDPTDVALIDDADYACRFLEKTARHLPGMKQARFLIHCFGDFYHHSREWLRIEDYLAGKQVELLAASEKAGAFLDQLLQGTQARVCPFPVREDVFRHDARERFRRRRELGIGADQSLIVYSGRLSLQKNIVELLKAAPSLLAPLGEGRKRPVLALAGAFDDLGPPHFGTSFQPGRYGLMVSRLLAELNREGRVEARWLGDLDEEDLRATLNAADGLMSLSLHHNEDYGMAVAEGLMTGLPALLTDWGGYSSFPGLAAEGAVRLVPVGIGPEGNPILKLGQAEREFVKTAFSPEGGGERRSAREADARRQLSVRAVADRLEALLAEHPSPGFAGFSPLLGKLASLGSLDVAFERYRFHDPVFRKLYAPYYSII